MMSPSNTKATIQTFAMNESGTYQEQFHRPFQTHVTAQNINRLQETTQGGQNVDISTVREVAGEMVGPQANVEGVANIANGWTSRRFHFFMTVKESNAILEASGETQRIFYGYTDHCDVSFRQSIDPNMRIYFNSEAQFNIASIPQPNGGVARQARVVSNSQILSPYDAVDPGQMQMGGFGGSNTLFLLRPEDIYSTSSSMAVAQRANDARLFEGQIHNTWNQASMVNNTERYRYSNREHNSPSRYLTDTLKGYHHSLREQEMNEGEFANYDPDFLFQTASKHLRNDRIYQTGFFQTLKENTEFVRNGYVTYAELCACFPETEYVTVANMDSQHSLRRMSSAMDSNHWHGSDNTTIAASLLSQVVPSLMMRSYIRGMSFTVHNGEGLGNYSIIPHQENIRMMIDHLDQLQHVQEFMRRLAVDVLDTITHRNQLYIQMSMMCDLSGESIIDISLGDDHNVRFVAPTFSDSLFSSMMTHDHDQANTIASDLSYMSREVVQPNQQNNFTGFATGGGYQGMNNPQPAPSHPNATTNTSGGNNGNFGLL